MQTPFKNKTEGIFFYLKIQWKIDVSDCQWGGYVAIKN